MPAIDPGYLSFDELVIYLGRSPHTIEEWIRVKNFPFYRPGWDRMFKVSEVDEWLKTYKGRRVRARGGFTRPAKKGAA